MSVFYDLSKTPRNILNQAIVRAIVSENGGALFAPSDMSTLYQDAAGTTPVTAVEQPVGLMLDKARGLMLGPELITNGDFSNGTTGWILEAGWSVVNNELQYNTGTGRNAYLNIPTVAGKAYLVTYEIKSLTNGGFGIFSVASSNVVAVSNYETTIGKKSAIVIATGTSADIKVRSFTTGTIGVIDNISVKELYGNHATQSVTASRPVLSARYNLLTKTEDFGDAVWGKYGISVQTNALAPNGTLSASKLIESTDTSTHALQAAAAFPISVNTSVMMWLKAAGRNYAFVSSGSRDVVSINLTTGVATVGAGDAININTLSAGGGWWLVSFNIQSPTSPILNIYASTDGVYANRLYTGDGVSGIYVWHPDVRLGTTSSPYQRVNTATDYDTDERYFKKYLRFDGIDDYFNLPWMNLAGSNLGTTTIVAMDSSASLHGVSYVISEKTTYTPVTAYGPIYLAYGLSHRVFMMKDNISLLDTGYGVQADRVNVFSVTDDLINITQRKNGAITNRVAFTHPAMVTNQTLIGAANHGGVIGGYLAGNLYGLIITKSALTDSQRIACESYLGRKSGVQL